MKFFERFRSGNTESENNSLSEEKTPEEEKRIVSSRDFRLALADKRFAAAEAYLMQEKENPSQSGHNDLWLQNMLLILWRSYKTVGFNEDAERIKNMLPENMQHMIEKQS